MNMKANTFDVFVREENERRFGVAIKRGFSWPGFLFSFFWAFANRLWLKGAILAFFINVLNAFSIAYGDDLPVAVLLGQLANLTILIIVGLKGNDWRRQDVLAKKFKLEKSIRADSSKEALAASDIATAEGLSYALKTFAIGSVFSAVLIFLFLLFWISYAYGDEKFAFTLFPAMFAFGLIGVPLILRAYFPPVRWYTALSIILGGILIGSGVQTVLLANVSVLAVLTQLLIGFLLLIIGFWAVIAGRRGEHANARG